MDFLDQFCCICLENDIHLNRLFDNNTINENYDSYYSKLIAIIPDMVSTEIHHNGMICTKCLIQLDAIDKFHEQCYRGKALLTHYMESLHSLNELKICLSQLSCADEQTLENFVKFANNYHNQDLFGILTDENKDISLETAELIEDDKDLGKYCEQTDMSKNVNKEENIENELLEVDEKESFELWTVAEKVFITPELEDTSKDIIKSINHRIDVPLLEETYDLKNDKTIKLQFSDSSEKCENVRSSLENLSTRKKTHNKTLYHCKDCDKKFSYYSLLIKHRRSHMHGKPFQCHHCGKTFSQLSHLKTHLLVHTGQKLFKCDCGKSFYRRERLLIHQRSHTGEKPYQCELCGKSFSTNDKLKVHHRIHTGLKPYKCDNCGKTFSQKATLIKHNRIHSGDRPFDCKECGKMFYSNSNLNRHVLTHTGLKPYKCECGKAFTQNANLIAHKRGHSGEKPFVCEVCEKAFTRKAELNRHKKKHM